MTWSKSWNLDYEFVDLSYRKLSDPDPDWPDDDTEQVTLIKPRRNK